MMDMTMNMGSMSGIPERIRMIFAQLQYSAYGDSRTILMALMGGLAFFGALNVILGFRLMRFWMMLGSVGLGFLLGYFLNSWIPMDKKVFLGVSLGAGFLLAILSFYIYNWGVFVVGLVSGSVLGVSLLHPTSSLTFFLCILFGAFLGILGMRYSRVILIIGTSVLGGALCGVTAAWFGDLLGIAGPLGIPYEGLLGAVFVILGIVIQFAMNPSKEEEDEEEEEETDPEEEFAEQLYRREIRDGKPVNSGNIRRDEFGRKYLD